jgi:hypothetical protein
VICVPGYQGKEHTHNIEWLFLIAVWNIFILTPSSAPSAKREHYRDRAVLRGARGTWLCCICFCLSSCTIFCRWYQLTLSDQAQISLQLRVSISNLV